jgi:hypothetical protein
MKNYYLTKLLKQFLLLAFFLTGILGYSQESKNPVKDVAGLKSNQPKVPHNFTATMVTLSKDASPEAKAEFVKLHGADFYYVYSDDKGKQVSKDELDIALQKEENNKNAQIKPITNPKK